VIRASTAIYVQIYTAPKWRHAGTLKTIIRDNLHEKAVPCGFRRSHCSCGCTKSGHTLVDELHSADFKVDGEACFLLTAKTGRVKRQSFFDSF
jgi:hypothetical protein